MGTDDDFDAREAPGDDAAAEQATPAEPAPTTEPVPTITGLFDMPHQARGDDGSDETRDEDPQPDFVDSSQPPTDSVRLIAEMFSGFRRRSATPEQDLQQILGTATQSLPVITDGRVAPSEPVATAGTIPIIQPSANVPDDETDADADAADEADDASSDEALIAEPTPVAHAAAPAALTRTPADEQDSADAPETVASPLASSETPQEDAMAAADAPPSPVTTAYVPREEGNETERALAWLTAENVGPGQTPHLQSAPGLVPQKRRRWIGAVFAPIITAIVLAVAYVVAFSVWPLTHVAPAIAEAEIDTPTAPVAELPWPETGQAGISIAGVDEPLLSATDEFPEVVAPMASLTKVISVMVLLERQPLELGEQGPEYEFGFLDQTEADALRWANESALDVPIGGTLTYYQMLEGILMGSAGNYVNKLVDELWEGDRDDFTTDALSWLQSHGIDDTLVVDATGISPDNQSTPSSMLKVSEIALEHPVVAEIAAKADTEIPGAGFVENSNPLIDDTGVVGIKTGHLDEWNIVSYNLTTAMDVETGDDEPTRVYAAVMGQPDDIAQEDVSRSLLGAVSESLQPVEAMSEGTVIARVQTPWGASTEVIADGTASLTLWNGEQAQVTSEYDIDLGDSAGDEVGTITIAGALDSDEIDLVATEDLPRPSLKWRLTHPLELLGISD
ncbi:hypothetical protein [Microbacterium sp. G2-8]|uniref:hypothetical protein n=1 Tax=Microbacterium sp. G2-8 TaxID=2842454 RepID=UPI001C890915|nr:hypothetical protein [Microbacterium sp. G2-8]